MPSGSQSSISSKWQNINVGETYRIDLLQTKYLSWLLNTLPNFFHLDSISIIFMLPKPKIWKIRVYGPISEIFWDLILPRWIIRIVFYKIVCVTSFFAKFLPPPQSIRTYKVERIKIGSLKKVPTEQNSALVRLFSILDRLY